MRGLIKTIKIFIKVAYKDRIILDEARRLFYVDLFMQVPIQEGGFDIHLMDLPFIICSKVKNKAYGVHFGNRVKGFGIVNVVNLLKTFSD